MERQLWRKLEEECNNVWNVRKVRWDTWEIHDNEDNI